MVVNFKVGSVVRVPKVSGLSFTSSDPATLSISDQGGFTTFSAAKVGACVIEVVAGTDVRVQWSVGVVAA